MMDYKGYKAEIEIDDEAGILHGSVINTRDVITFEGESVEELRTAFGESVEDYLEFCQETARSPEKPFSGNFQVRVSPELHRRVSTAAKISGQSLNTYVAATLEIASTGTMTTIDVSFSPADGKRRGRKIKRRELARKTRAAQPG